MIVWLASYPKSGNTYLRALLASYFFSKDGEFTFELLKSIQKFPNFKHFKSLDIDCENEVNIFKNYIKAQEDINKKKKEIVFLKTHSSFCNIGEHVFSDLKNTLAAIYVVRDPRNVALSMANYYSVENKECVRRLISQQTDILDNTENKNFKNYLGSWSFHFNSWKRLKNRLLIIKYENLILNPKKEILSILNFISSIIGSKIQINENKLDKSINNTKFEKLRHLEKSSGFHENASISKNNFFNKGLKTDFNTDLDIHLRMEIETNFKDDLKELNYL